MRQTDFASKNQEAIENFNFEEKSREIMSRKKNRRVMAIETKPSFKDYT